MHALVRIVVAAAVAAAIAPAHAEPASALPDYPSEVEFLVGTPGASGSIAAGFFNPGAWAIQRHGGMFFGWDDAAGGSDFDAYTGMLSLRHLGFGVRRFRGLDTGGRETHLNDYTLGIAHGNRASTWGVSYGWGGGDLDLNPRHERLTLGSVSRIRVASLGLASTWDLERRDYTLQGDLGIRPFGPRLTLFADADYRRDESFGDIRSGYGAEVHALPGLTIAGKVRSTGEFSFRLNLSPGPFGTLSARPHLNDAGDRIASTYAVELAGPVPSLGHGFTGRGRAFPEVNLRGRMGTQRYRYFDKSRTLLGTLSQWDAWSDDPGVGGVVLNISGMRIGPEMLWELRSQLAGMRARGKKVVVYGDEMNMYSYMLASVADEIWMDPQGGLDIVGLTLGRTYMRHALEKMGLGVDEWRFFTYKSAFEGYSRDSMSEPDREQRQALVDDAYETIASAVTASRGLTRAKWDALVDSVAAFRPREAQAAGLVDSVGSFERARESARRIAPRTVVDADATALGGIHGDPVWGPEEWGEPARIAVLYAIGPCDMETGIRGRVLSRAIERARKDRNVKAVVLRADSPGGDPLPSDLVARELRATAKVKPVIVSQGQVAASGGYWISMDADTIVASPLTITGSIGVIAGFVWNKELGDKIGLDYDHVQRGEHADIGQGFVVPYLNARVPARPVTPDERAHAEKIIRSLYDEFVGKVAVGRGMTPASVDAIGQGRVWSGTRGREVGLVDELGGLWHSIRIAKEAAGIPASRPIAFDEGPDRGAFDTSVLRPRLLGLDAEATPVASPFTPMEKAYLEALARSRGKPLLWLEPLDIQDGGPQP